MKRTIALAAILSSLAVAASPSFAGETGLPEDFDLSAGIAFTTNYVSKGATQTEDKPAVQGYLEATYGVFYLGAWASNTSFADPMWDPSSEIDFYGGIRPEIGNLSLDIGFAKYYYPDLPTENYGDIYVKGSFAFTESFSAGAEFFHEIYGGPEWGNLTTEIAAVAIDDEVWISNPVTGDFETLPPGFDIDPSRFFDPEDGWQPLLANLRDVELVGIDDRGGERYHVRGVAPASEVENITVGLVDGQDVPVDLWIHPGTHLVTHLEFSTTIDGADSQWELDLDRYGESFTIRPPANVRTGVDS